MTDSPPPPSHIHPDEWAARLELAACYRIFARLGWTEQIYNHISVRLPATIAGGEPQFLINRFGLLYTEITASNLVRIDLQGQVADGSVDAVNPAGFTVHAALHAGLPGAHCVMHTHTTAGLAVACLEDGLDPSNFYSAQLHGQVAYRDFEGITLRADEGPRLLRSIGGRPAVILRNHGLLTWGETLPHAFSVMWTLQRACEVQLATLSMGRSRRIPAAVAQQCAQDALRFDPRHAAGQGMFGALLRELQRLEPDFQS